ncbi:uncharacterized protein LACBIDRAFT_298891 [Laccaria bicolor S238N-H82]|uniref:Predicted protein n=1 Tax=Laccaria bicolor (strain S238N-H82 / ATCC MYA-4686) TaxID=486041 RepID=B0DE88_LACBS|nr:uncharacterized protein LACBIDRAFT_298891 [Laccaria bicolor S238N-H82]EDR07223.1 predicted protein [Laccaria bicolor S238N-H82]|eukprot:XP_001882154.1 predicted protein [Laccaria bicolor S238N-H82]
MQGAVITAPAWFSDARSKSCFGCRRQYPAAVSGAGAVAATSTTIVRTCPSTNIQNKRAGAKLRLAIERTKRTMSASPRAATCSVELLKDGLDYTGSINRMRFDMVASTVYTTFADSIVTLFTPAAVDAYGVDEIV